MTITPHAFQHDHEFQHDLDTVASIPAIPLILEVVCRTTGLRFAAVARVTEARWIACAVRDDIAFGLLPGSELKVETTICNEIRASREAVVIDHVSQHPHFRAHPTLFRVSLGPFALTVHGGRDRTSRRRGAINQANIHVQATSQL